jgi:hypothetical protein
MVRAISSKKYNTEHDAKYRYSTTIIFTVRGIWEIFVTTTFYPKEDWTTDIRDIMLKLNTNLEEKVIDHDEYVSNMNLGIANMLGENTVSIYWSSWKEIHKDKHKYILKGVGENVKRIGKELFYYRS